MFKKLSFISIILCLTASVAFASDPVLYFSDIINGPDTGLGDGIGSGAIVTVWGVNLGSSQGASTIYFKDSTTTARAGVVYCWCNADGGTSGGGPANLYTSHEMQEISFSIPDSATGAGTIYVTVGGVNSNELVFTVRSGSIYWISNTGSEANDGSYANPWLNITQYSKVQAMAAGSIVYNKGNYSLSASQTFRNSAGTAENPKAIVCYPGTNITITTTGSGIGHYPYGTSTYWVFSKFRLIVEASGFSVFPYSRYVGNEVTDSTCAEGSGGAFTSGGYHGGSKMLGNYVHDFGCYATSNQHHTMYFSVRGIGSDIASFEIGWNYLIDNDARFGIHFYDEHACWGYTGTVLVHHNWVENQVGPGFNMGGWICDAGYDISGDFDIYENMFINCGQLGANNTSIPAVNVQGDEVVGHYRFWNNTIYGYGYSGASPDAYTGGVTIPGTGYPTAERILGGTWEWINNIVVDIQGFAFVGGNSKTPTAHKNNLWYDSAALSAPAWDTSPIETDPKFTVAGSDYTLQTTSPAIDAGSSDVSALVTMDFLGYSWSGETYEVGAFGYDMGGVDVTAPTLLTATIGLDGRTYTFGLSENMTFGADGNGYWSVSTSTQGVIALTYSHGSGTNTLVYTGDKTVLSGETITAGLDYAQPGDGAKDTAGNLLLTIDDNAVTNNSGQTAEAETSPWTFQYNAGKEAAKYNASGVIVKGP